jgi:diguanylate cyclase (GGDEF)-like protein
MVDLDKFKPINDQYGHEAGNECIVQLSQYLKNEMEDIGSVARYGGDEFILFLPNTEAAEAEQIAIAIHEKLEEKEFTVTNYMSREREEVRLSMSGSFGVSEYHPDFKTIKEYIASADRVMYLHSKGNETNKVSVFRKGEYLTV